VIKFPWPLELKTAPYHYTPFTMEIGMGYFPYFPIFQCKSNNY